MQFALSTLGCPELTLPQAAELASTSGYAGLEVRSAPDATVNRHASPAQQRSWRHELAARSVACVSVASYVRLCDESIDTDTFMAYATGELHLARSLNATWLRIFAGGPKGIPCPADVEDRASLRLGYLAQVASRMGVGVAVETHDSHPTARDITRLLGKADAATVAVIWDVLHTWLAGEAPATTMALTRDRLAYVQVKDVPARDNMTPALLGEGVLPLRTCVDLVRAQNPHSWIAWEYERKWHPQAPSLTDVAAAGYQWLTAAGRTPA